MRENGCLLLTGYYWSFSMCCQSQIHQIVGLVLACCPSQSCEAGHQLTSQMVVLKGISILTLTVLEESSQGQKQTSLSVRTVRRVWNLVCAWLLSQQPWNFIPEKKKISEHFWENDWLHLFVIGASLKMSAAATESLNRGVISVVYEKKHCSILEDYQT